LNRAAWTQILDRLIHSVRDHQYLRRELPQLTTGVPRREPRRISPIRARGTANGTYAIPLDLGRDLLMAGGHANVCDFLNTALLSHASSVRGLSPLRKLASVSFQNSCVEQIGPSNALSKIRGSIATDLDALPRCQELDSGAGAAVGGLPCLKPNVCDLKAKSLWARLPALAARIPSSKKSSLKSRRRYRAPRSRAKSRDPRGRIPYMEAPRRVVRHNRLLPTRPIPSTEQANPARGSGRSQLQRPE